MTKRNIKCNRRLSKKYLKKAHLIHLSQPNINKYGIKAFHKCYSFSCPIASEADFEDLLEAENRDDFSEIEAQEDMPQGWGDDLMIITLDDAKKLEII